VINIGPDEESVTIEELAYHIMMLTGFKGRPVYMPGRPQEVRTALCCSDKARKYLGYQTTVSLDEGLRTMVEHIRKHGTKKFKYHLPIEIMSDKTPKTWTDQLF
jgi:UDP-glucose 4-epimerase